MSSPSAMGAFWDRRAHENPFYFIDNRVDYRSPDLEGFWADGDRTVDALLSRLGVVVEPSDTLVEIGCGVGRLTRPLAARAARVVALDVSGQMIELAREHNPSLSNVSWMLGDGTSLAGVEARSADACFSHVVFQHIPDPQVTLGYVREMGRVLSTGGWAAFHVSSDPSIHRSRTGLLAKASARLGRAPGGQDAPEWLGSAVETADLRRAAGDGGMKLERIVGEGTQFCLVLCRKVGAGHSAG